MKLNKISKSELELLSYTEIAKLYLEENKTTINTANLFKEVCNLLELSESEYVEKIADFFQSLTTSKEFILLENGNWDLKSNHKVKVIIDDDDESSQDELDEKNKDEIVLDEEEPDDLDNIDDNDNFIEDDSDDELADLTIVNDDELEE